MLLYFGLVYWLFSLTYAALVYCSDLDAMDPTAVHEQESQPRSPLHRDDQDDNASTTSSSLSSSFDFTRAAMVPQWPSIEQAPKSRTVLVKDDDSPDEDPRMMTFNSDETADIFTDIIDEFDFPQESKVILRYPLFTGEDTQQWTTLKSSSKNVTKNLATMYCQIGQMETLHVSRLKPKRSRAKRPSEWTFDTFKGLNTINKTAYEYIVKNRAIGRSFLEKSRFCCVWLGSKSSVNFLNPADFICPIKTCGVVFLKLNHYNNLSLVRVHLDVHLDKELEQSVEKELTTILLKRYEYLTSSSFLQERRAEPLRKLLEDMDEVEINGTPLTLKDAKNNMYIASKQSEFKGKHLLMKRSVVKNIVDLVKDPLKDLVHNDIAGYFPS